MMKEDTFKIHLYVADEDFYVEIPKDENEELLYRKAVKEVDRLIRAYRDKYKHSDNTELDFKKLLAMTALHLAKDKMMLQGMKDDSHCLQRIAELDKDLEAFLSKE